MNWFRIVVFFSVMIGSNVFGQLRPDKLSYDFGSLEPYLDSTTMRIHYTKHYMTYIDNFNKAYAASNNGERELISILKKISTKNDAYRNNAGGYYNHSLFWKILTPNTNTLPSPLLIEKIKSKWGSLDSMKRYINTLAMSKFGSGWVWLCVDKNLDLVVLTTSNQDNPLMDIASIQATPILAIDLWEHAYYLKFQNRRAEYMHTIWNVINWQEVSSRYEKALFLEEENIPMF